MNATISYPIIIHLSATPNLNAGDIVVDLVHHRRVAKEHRTYGLSVWWNNPFFVTRLSITEYDILLKS